MEATERAGYPGRVRRLALAACMFVVVYGNLAVTFQPRKLGLGRQPFGLWLPRPLHDAFLLPGMFSGFFGHAFDYVLEGRAADGRWMRLPIKEHFPLRHGVTYTQLWAPHHREMFGPSRQREIWAAYAQQIRRRHNRLHPDLPIERVRFGVEHWPLSSQGYRARKTPDELKRTLWYSEPDP